MGTESDGESRLGTRQPHRDRSTVRVFFKRSKRKATVAQGDVLGEWRYRNANNNAAHADADSHAHTDGYADAHTHADANKNTYGNENAHTNAHGHTHVDGC
jgi:hypothetical protein